MLAYLKAKDDQKAVQEFASSVQVLWKLEDERYQARRARGYPVAAPLPEGYDDARASVARQWIAASRVADRLGVPHEAVSYPAPIVGGPVYTIDLFQAVLDDPRGTVKRQHIADALNATLGACEERVRSEWISLFNPFSWVSALIRGIIRLPFAALSASGFNLSKVEDHFLSKIFKLLELVILVGGGVWLALNHPRVLAIVERLLSSAANLPPG